MPPLVVLDTPVILSALRSKHGASHLLLSLVGRGLFDIAVSVPLALEYEEVAKRFAHEIGLEEAEIDDVLDYLCSVAFRRKIFYLWRPYLKDADDDMVLELAVEARCDGIVTFNVRDFSGVDRFGLWVLPPRDFLRLIGVLR